MQLGAVGVSEVLYDARNEGGFIQTWCLKGMLEGKEYIFLDIVFTLGFRYDDTGLGLQDDALNPYPRPKNFYHQLIIV